MLYEHYLNVIRILHVPVTPRLRDVTLQDFTIKIVKPDSTEEASRFEITAMV